MEISKELGDHEREEMASFNLPPIGAMQLAAGTGFGHNIEIISHACHARPKNTDFDIEEGESGADVFRYGPLPVYLKAHIMFPKLSIIYHVLWLDIIKIFDN